MALLNTQQLITLVLTMLSEPDGLTTGTPYWSRADVLQRMNLQQSKIATELPDLFKTIDTSLTTTGVTGGYIIPSTIGRVTDVEVNNVACYPISRDALVAMSLRGDIETNWENTAGAVSPQNFLYYYIDIDNSSGTEQQMLYFYPFPASSGQTIQIKGELILSNVSDLTTSFPFQNVAYLEKAQEVLVKLTAQWHAMEGKPELYKMLNDEIFGPEGSTNNKGLTGILKTQYMVLRVNPQESMIKVKRSEDINTNLVSFSRAKPSS